MRFRHFLSYPVKYLDSKYNKRAVRELYEKFQESEISLSQIRRDYNFRRDRGAILLLHSMINSSSVSEEIRSDYFLSIVTKAEGRPSENLAHFLAELTR